MGGKAGPRAETRHASFPNRQSIRRPSKDRILGSGVRGSPGRRRPVWVRRGPGRWFQNGWRDRREQGRPLALPNTRLSEVPRKPASSWMRETEAVSEAFPGKAKAGYRSSVLGYRCTDGRVSEAADGRAPREAQEWMRSARRAPGLGPERPGCKGEADQRRRSLKGAPRSRGSPETGQFLQKPTLVPLLAPAEYTWQRRRGQPPTKVSSPSGATPHSAPPEKNPGASLGHTAGPGRKGRSPEDGEDLC